MICCREEQPHFLHLGLLPCFRVMMSGLWWQPHKSNIVHKTLFWHITVVYLKKCFAGFIDIIEQNSQQSKAEENGPPPGYEPKATSSERQQNTEKGKMLLNVMFLSSLTSLKFLSIHFLSSPLLHSQWGSCWSRLELPWGESGVSPHTTRQFMDK